METHNFGFLFFSFIFSTYIICSSSTDTLAADQSIVDNGNGTIISSGGIFEMGFFSPGRSKNRYIGIWYRKISNRTVVWVANRNSPVTSTLGVFSLNENGSLELMDASGRKIWSSNSSSPSANPMVAQLFDTGNFAVRYKDNSDPGNYLWQSFDFPCDNLLPGMKLGWDLVKGLDRYVSSWKSVDDPSPGIFVQRLDLSGYPQLLLFAASDVVFRYGPWDGIQFSGVSFFRQFSGVSFFRPDIYFELKLISTKQEIYFTFELNNNSTTPVRFVLQPDGEIQLLMYMARTQNWTYGSSDPNVLWDDCDQYAFCGAYGSCNITQAKAGQQACSCLRGYQPRFAERWRVGNWSDGCVRKTQFSCNSTDVFVKYPGLKLPDTRTSWFNQTMSLDECKEQCTKNCSCTAYSNVDIRQGGTGCLLWFTELMDLRDYKVNGLDLFVRVAASELDQQNALSGKARKGSTVVIAIVSVLGTVIVSTIVVLIYKKREQRRKEQSLVNLKREVRNETEGQDLELPLYDMNTIATATDNFSQNNWLGEGGFGPVYKGKLDGEKEIAVKRLSKTSRQGLDEFKNEVSCIAKLQHRNLVRLLGCCIDGGEMLLIYEYMPNKSLDFFIFDKVLSKKLDWPKRNNIINGTAKGLLYLHQDSRLRIIHRDLKAGNILLDHDMSPRIADFGLARSFGGNESAVNTARVVGTYGYMSPEYAIDGLFSVKSDAYSFGVVILEIVSGKKIRQFYDSETNLNLLGHAWKLFKEGKVMDLVDESIVETCNVSEVWRVIHIALLCVQPFPKDRPNMSFIVAMLCSGAELPEPKQPCFFTERGMQDSDPSPNKCTFISNNEMTTTYIAPR